MFWCAGYFYVGPVFRSRCASVGKRFRISRMPFVTGHAKIHIGDDVNFFGKVDIFSSRIFDEPMLVLKDRVDIGHSSFILKGVTIGEAAIVGVNSVVLADVPPYAVAMGNPARVVVKAPPKRVNLPEESGPPETRNSSATP